MRAPLHHSDGISANTQRVSNAVQPALGTLEDVALLSKICQNSAPTVQEIIELVVGIGEEGLFAKGVALPIVIGWACAEAESG